MRYLFATFSGPILLALGPIALGNAALSAPSGHWRLTDDDIVIEFTSCPSNASAVCIFVRALPKTGVPDSAPPKCGQLIGWDFEPDMQQRWSGKVLDYADGEVYRARLQPRTAGSWDLVVIAMGGLYTAGIPMVPAHEFVACSASR
jgi:hypothetical protein